MKKLISLLLVVIMVLSMMPATVFAQEVTGVTLYDLKTNDLVSPIGLDLNPVFSWKMQSNTIGQAQTAYRLVVSADAALTSPVWDSGKVESGLSTGIAYAGSDLVASTVYYWQVTVWDKDGKEVKSSVEHFETGLLSENAWDDVQFISVADSNKTHYTVEYETHAKAYGSSFAFGAINDKTCYILQLRVDGSNVKYKPKTYIDGTLSDIADHIKTVTDITGTPDQFKTTPVKVKLDVTPKFITVYLNGTQVDELAVNGSIPVEGIGKVGIRTTASGSEQSYFDNIVITDYTENAAGVKVLSYTFDDGVNPFGVGEIINGEFYATKFGAPMLDTLTTFPGFLYTVEADIRVASKAAGLLFGGINANTAYMWQLNINDSSVAKLNPHTVVSGAYTSLTSVDITAACGSVSNVKEKGVKMKIEVTEDTIKTYIDGTLVYTCEPAATIPTNVIGKVGVRTSGGSEKGYFDNIVVTDYSGVTPKTVVSYTFDDGVNPFTDTTGTCEIQNGVLYAYRSALALDTLTTFPKVEVEEAETVGTPSFRKDFTVKEGLVSARLYTTALGTYDAFVNGERVGHLQSDGTTVYDELKPGFTETQKRKFYYTNDITHLLKTGTNALSAWVTTGWWNGDIVLNRGGNENAFAAKLLLTYADGTKEVLNTDTTWQAAYAGPMVFADIYAGETYDATKSKDWMQPGFAGWETAEQNKEYTGIITAHYGPKTIVRQDLTRKPVDMYVYTAGNVTGNNSLNYGTVVKNRSYTDGQAITLNAGEVLVVDLGQNFAGWEQFTVSGEAGTTVTVRHAEILNAHNGSKIRQSDGPEGSVNVKNLAGAKATTTYILGGSEETYHPTMTYYGHRYLEFTADAAVTISNISGQVVTSVTLDSGDIVTSDPAVNQLVSNTRWSQYSNYLSVPTDCPNRDERYGWAGDAQVFAATGAYNSTDTKPFLQKWLQDYRDGQFTDPTSEFYGANYSNAPRSRKTGSIGRYGWNDATVIIPYNMWMMTGDMGIVEEQYDAMKLYVDQWLGSTDKKGGDRGYGDWLSPQGNDETLRALLGVAYYAWDAMLMSEMAAALGKTEDAAKYAALYETEKEYFIQQFVKEDGSLTTPQQTALLYALYLDLLPDENSRQVVRQSLAENLAGTGDHVATGFLGTAIILKALSEADMTEQAYKLLLQRSYPSWLYPIGHGATTIYESWKSYTEEQGFMRLTGNRSLNHYNNGCVVEWIYRYAAGIGYDEAQPGFKRIVLAPEPSRMMENITVTYDSVYGPIKSAWAYNSNLFTYEASIPANTTAEIRVPVEDLNSLTVNGKTYTALTKAADGIAFVKAENGVAIFDAVAGSFTFSAAAAENIYLTVNMGKTDGVPALLSVDGGDYRRMTQIVKVEKGQSVTLRAKSENDVDYVVEAWKDAAGNVIGTDGELTLTPTANATLTVDFVRDGLESIALGAKVTASHSRSQTRYAAANLTDGALYAAYNDTYGWSAEGATVDVLGTGAVLNVPVWAVIDLGEVKTMNRFHLYPFTEDFPYGIPVGMPVDYTISVSDDNATWKEVYAVTCGEANCYKPTVIQLDKAVSGQYVKLEVTKISQPYYDNYGAGTARVQIGEFGIYNVDETKTLTVKAGETFGMDTEIKVGDGEWQSLPATFKLEGESAILQARHANSVDYGVGAWKDADGKILSKQDMLQVTAKSGTELTVDFAWHGYDSIAQGSAVSGSKTTVSGTWQREFLVDGILNHLGGNNGWLSANVTSNVTDGVISPAVDVVMDLGTAKTMNRFHLYPRTDIHMENGKPYCYPVEYTISVSDNNSTWTEVASVTGGSVKAWEPAVVQLDKSVTGRYVKLSVTKTTGADNNGKYWVQLAEFGAYNTVPTFTAAVSHGENLHLGVSFPAINVPGGASAVITRNYADGRTPAVKTVSVDAITAFDGLFAVTMDNVDFKGIGDTVTVTLQNAKGDTLSTWSGSLESAICAALASGENKDVLLATLNLGAAAQSFFGYGTPSTAMAEEIAALKAARAEEIAALKQDNSTISEDTSLIYGTSFVLDADLQMKVYFHVDPAKHAFDNLDFVINGNAVTPTEVGENMYSVTIPVPAWDFMNTVTIQVTKGDAVLATASDSLPSYCARLAKTENTALAEAMMLYAVTVSEQFAGYEDVSLDLLAEETSYKSYGRMYETETGLAITYPGSGIEFAADCVGDVTMAYTADDGCWFRTFVDGQALPRVHAEEGTGSITVAEDIAPGVHNIRIIRDSDVFTLNNDAFAVTSLSFNAKEGTVQRPADKDLYIEFVGDSIPSGQGSLVEFLVTDAEGKLKIATKDADDPSHSGTHSYAYLTAQKLNADWNMLSRGGMGYFKTSTLSHKTIEKVYPYYNGFMSEDKLIPYTAARQADVAVLALSTNDYDDAVTEEAIASNKTSYKSKEAALQWLIEQVRQQNGDDVKIVIIYNMMLSNNNWVDAFTAVDTADDNVFLLKTTRNKEGGSDHPSAAGHAVIAQELATFIKTTVLA